MSGVIGKIGSKTGTVDELDLSTDYLLVKPHIIPDVLYPAVANIMVDGSTALSAVTTGPNGSTVASSKYGTVQSDGRMYYYTDIKGSKPIKDPRIGAHFGSQRHKITSIQLLEQETATHGQNVYSVDGREWMRAHGTSSQVAMSSDPQGVYLRLSTATTTFIEITGYFSDINLNLKAYSTNRGYVYSVDGAVASSEKGDFEGTNTPLASRYLDCSSVVNLRLGLTLGIHTIKVNPYASGDYLDWFNIELIAQDSNSKTRIQIPSQNVVSFGKKFTVAGTPRFNPFAYAADGTTAVAIADTTSHGKVATGWAGTGAGYFDDTLDEATSLGLSAWEKGGNYWRPVNGGRIVKWVDSSGNIKTSVNMMPPAGRAIIAGGNNGDPDGTSWITGYQPSIMAGSIDHSQAEVAKTFYWREFGNGGANQGPGGSYADFSVVTTIDKLAYVMDDGLTSLSGDDVKESSGVLRPDGDTDHYYITFIGTGIGVAENLTQKTSATVAQNLPYGTHILKVMRDGDTTPDLTLDGIAFANLGSPYPNTGEASEFTFHQPKMPPIPEDAVVIADYMLMADFASLGTGNNGDKLTLLPKGVRRISSSRDMLYSGGTWSIIHPDSTLSPGGGMRMDSDTDTTTQASISFFGNKAIWYGGDPVTRLNDSNCTFTPGTKGTTVEVSSTNTVNIGSREFSITDGPIATTFKGDNTGASNAYGTKNEISCFDVVTPIHTSSHYQTFETPFLHELVGGDRNMEQTNLVVTPDGKTWDEVTRDVSYLGSRCSAVLARDGGDVSGAYYAWDYYRGVNEGVNYHTKGFAIANERLIFLEAGTYRASLMLTSSTNGGVWRAKIRHNYGDLLQMNQDPDSNEPNSGSCTVLIHAQRGEWVWVYVEVGTVEGDLLYRNRFQIEKVG